MKGSGTKLILLLPFLHKPPTAAVFHHRLWIAVFLSLSTLTFLLTFLHCDPHNTLYAATPTTSRLNPDVAGALLHYAAAANATDRMSAEELSSVAAALRRRPSNLLVFGLTAETLLWHALNRGGRTVFLDEKEYLISKYESSVDGFEGYDVRYTTKVSEFKDLISDAKSRRKTDCQPVQNLLFSECSLAINDLPNELYSIPWDVILVDGPSGYTANSPGRMSAIFTAAVMARSKRGGAGRRTTDVFVHDGKREVEKVSTEEFLCSENRVEMKGSLAHFLVPEMDSGTFEFCTDGGVGGGDGSPTVASS
ncbi:uncharacterized protein [Phyllobates terribilis]|uniref:uncharacterized protein n=1 Tax=Phyllobates terribilis TaxID=111132 RepID=UPI003CCAD977